MPDLLLELFSEEIPARMQKRAAEDLRKRVTDALVDAGLTYEGAKEYWTPRRLAIDLRGLTPRSADIREERKGPRTDAPEKAIEGFLRGAGLSSVDQAQTRSDPKKGEFYVAVIEKPGRDAEEIIAEVMPGIVREFPWPKSMRWGAASREPGSLRWVRPLHSIVCTFGPETEETRVIPFEVDGIVAGNTTRGHRFMAPDEITVTRFDDYAEKLEKAFVMLDAERRRDTILADARNLAFAQGFELVEDEGLANETANLVEWPVVLMGEFEEDFLAIPDEVVQLTIRENQKCFVLRKQGSDQLINRFVPVSNIIASDGGAEIARGNGKVVRARLSDAKFFWESDLQQTARPDGFDEWVAGLDQVTFHAKLGSQGERVKRIMALAEELAPIVAARNRVGDAGAEEAPGRSGRARAADASASGVSAEELSRKAKRAAFLAKADLQSAMVFEFPEVQGSMGRRYAEIAGEDPSVALAIEEHYKPLGPSDVVPTDPVSVTVALADKIDTLVGFWAIDEKPTGSKDPYALRRAALGVIRLVLENGIRWSVNDLVSAKFSSEFLARISGFALKLEAFEDLSRGYAGQKGADLLEALDEAYIAPVFRFLLDKEKISTQISLLKCNPEFDSDCSEYPSQDYEKAVEEISSAFSLFEPTVASGGQLTAEEQRKLDIVAGNFATDLLSFFHDRLKVYLRDEGVRHDILDAIITPESDDLLVIARKARALQKLADTDDGENLIAGYKRAANILAAEEKKGTRIAGEVDPGLFETDEERALFETIGDVELLAAKAIEAEDFEGAMTRLATLRAPVDAFFDNVMVNAEDEAVRANRLAVLARIRAATATVADLSKIGG